MKIQKHLAAEYDSILAKTKEDLKDVILYALHYMAHAKDKTGKKLVDESYLKKLNLFNAVQIDYALPFRQSVYVGCIAQDRNVDEDDVINFALFMYLSFKKKNVIDEHWNTQRMLIALETCGLLDEVQTIKLNDNKEEFIVLAECPLCHHELSSVLTNRTASARCFKGDCDIKDVWDILTHHHKTFKKAIEAVWDAAIVHYEQNQVRVEKWGGKTAAPKPKKSSTQKSTEKKKSDYNVTPHLLKIIENHCDQTEGFQYLYKKGYKKKDLLDCDVSYRDGYISPVYRESNDFRNRIIYLTRDVDGNPVGVNGRSLIEDKEERRAFVESDSYWQEQLKALPEHDRKTKHKKLLEKTMNNYNYRRSDHLYLLHKYKDMLKDYKSYLPPTVIVVEGPKDAVRIYTYIGNNSSRATVSPIGVDLSTRQIELLREVFGLNAHIVMAFDQDKGGINGNLICAEKLKRAGFEKVSFLRYRENFNDFGDVNAKEYTRHLVMSMLGDTISREKYIEVMKKRGFESDEDAVS